MPGSCLSARVFCYEGEVVIQTAQGLSRAGGGAVDEHIRAALKGCRFDARDAGRNADLRQLCAVFEGPLANGCTAVRDFHDCHEQALKGAFLHGFDIARQNEGRQTKDGKCSIGYGIRCRTGHGYDVLAPALEGIGVLSCCCPGGCLAGVSRRHSINDLACRQENMEN